MRIVQNLNDTIKCPNCGCHMLYGPIENSESPIKRMFKLCTICNEEIYENETTCSEEQHTIAYMPEILGSNEAVEAQKKKEKENFIFEMREEISNLTWSIHDSQTQILVENIQNILNRIIDYIEEN